MSKTLKGYANYGCLAAEKRIVFTQSNPASTAKVSDEIEFDIPDGWELVENSMGQPIVTAPWGWDYTPNDLLGGKENPYFTGINPETNKQFNIKLDWRKL